MQSLEWRYVRDTHPRKEVMKLMKRFLYCLAGVLCLVLLLGGATLADEMTWAELQAAIFGAANGATITLTSQVSANVNHSDTALVIPSGKNITLDLNGNLLWRNTIGTDPSATGSVIQVKQGATLTIVDSVGGGRIAGGSAYNGGGIYNQGTLTLNGVWIGGDRASLANKTSFGGAGVYNGETGTVTISGGRVEHNTVTGDFGGGGLYNLGTMYLTDVTVANNTAKSYGGGIFNGRSGVLYLGGKVVVTGNTVSGAVNNLALFENTLLRASSALDADARIGVNLASTTVKESTAFTTGFAGMGPAACFVPDDSALAAGLNASGEVQLGAPVTLTLNAGEGTGTMSAIRVAKNSVVALPECAYTAPAGKSFFAWQIGSDAANRKAPGETVTLSANETAIAIWQSDWQKLQQQIDEAGDGATITLTESVLAVEGDVALVIPRARRSPSI